MQFPKFEILYLLFLNLSSLANTGSDTSLYGFTCQMEFCCFNHFCSNAWQSSQWCNAKLETNAQSTFKIILSFVCRIISQFNFTKELSHLDIKGFCNLLNYHSPEGLKIKKWKVLILCFIKTQEITTLYYWNFFLIYFIWLTTAIF